MSITEANEMIIRVVLNILREENLPTTETIRNAVRHVVKMFQEMKQYTEIGNAEEEQLVREGCN